MVAPNRKQLIEMYNSAIDNCRKSNKKAAELRKLKRDVINIVNSRNAGACCCCTALKKILFKDDN